MSMLGALMTSLGLLLAGNLMGRRLELLLAALLYGEHPLAEGNVQEPLHLPLLQTSSYMPIHRDQPPHVLPPHF